MADKHQRLSGRTSLAVREQAAQVYAMSPECSIISSTVSHTYLAMCPWSPKVWAHLQGRLLLGQLCEKQSMCSTYVQVTSAHTFENVAGHTREMIHIST